MRIIVAASVAARSPGKPGTVRTAEYRARHPERAEASRKASRAKRNAAISAIKVERGCAQCGFDDPRALDFHHLDQDDKTDAVSALRRGKAMETIMAEIDKCEVLCANCHRVAHAEARGDLTATVANFFRAA